MKLRELFDKMTPGMLDCDVTVRINTILKNTSGEEVGQGLTIRPIEKVYIQDDGSVTLVVTE